MSDFPPPSHPRTHLPCFPHSLFPSLHPQTRKCVTREQMPSSQEGVGETLIVHLWGLWQETRGFRASQKQGTPPQNCDLDSLPFSEGSR